MMRVVMLASGSRGDVQPYLAETALAPCLARDDWHRAAPYITHWRISTGEHEAALAHLREAVALFAAIGRDQPAIWMLTEW